MDPLYLNKYKTLESPFAHYGLGEFVYKRTYSRNNEQWYETINRVVNGLFNLKNNYTINNQKDKEIFYDLLFNAKFLPGGRSLWSMGTKITEQKHIYEALNNCAAISTKDISSKPFEFLFDLCMLGCGVGFDTAGANKLIINKPLIESKEYIIEDSREGWVKALKHCLNQYFKKNKKQIIFNYSKIRKEGQLLKVFGGTSSGSDPLKKSLNDIQNLLNSHINEYLSQRMIVDICNMICLCVISGNVRRSATIAIGEPTDEFLDLKNYEKNPERAEYCWLSNNSIIANLGMDYQKIANRIPKMGEPGILWIDNMKKYQRMNGIIDNKDINIIGTNPCGEISLENGELCNLVEVFINRQSSYEDFENTLKYAYRYAKIVSLCDTHWELTNKVINKNHRLGISLTGIANFIEDKGINVLRDWTTKGYEFLKNQDKEFSAYLNTTESIKLTCIKPSGTISLLIPDTCPGIHYPIGRYYIRRVRINNNHTSLINQMKEKGYLIEPSQTEPNTSIINFIIDNKCKRQIDDISMWEQLEIASKLQEWWADNQVQCTIQFEEKEAKDIKYALNLYQYKLKGIQFLQKIKNMYLPQLPYEKITKEQFESYNKPTNIQIDIDNNQQEEELFCTTETCELKSIHKYKTKHIIFMQGITGQGKSFIATKIKEYYSSLNKDNAVIIQNDQFRYIKNIGYVYDKKYEVSVNKQFKDLLKQYLLSQKHKYIIIDNTNIDKQRIDDTLEFIKQINENISFIILMIPPFKTIEKHTIENKHNIDILAVNRQLESYQKALKEIPYKTLKIDRLEDSYISIEQINKQIKELDQYFN